MTSRIRTVLNMTMLPRPWGVLSGLALFMLAQTHAESPVTSSDDSSIDDFTMPSVRSTFPAAQAVLFGAALVNAGPPSCPSNGQLSCHNSSAVQDTCCFNAPGGQLLLTQFWDNNPPTGPVDSWTVHGLWPDHCDGGFDANCDPNRAYTNITQILQAAGQTDLLNYMNTYWKDYQGNDESFWEHEWAKHGTCISTLEPSCYSDYVPQEEVVDFFNKAVSLFQNLTSYQYLSDAGITPSSTKSYALSDVQAALKAPRGVDATVQCRNGALDEIWYHFNVRGSVQSGEFVAAEPDGSKGSCGSTVKYLPKTSGGSTPTSTATRTSTAAPTGTAPAGSPFAGKGYVNVVVDGQTKGCLISNGKWYIGGTCATYTASGSGDTFTLKSSKGACAVDSGTFECGGSASTSFGQNPSGTLAYQDSNAFFAASTPSGGSQVALTTQGDMQVSLEWQSM